MDSYRVSTGRGIALALVSAGAFALSGSLASSLFEAGWSPGAAVTVRIAIAAGLLLPPAAKQMHGRWSLLRPNLHLIVMFGALAVAGAQLFYFNAVQTLSVGVALMLEYTGLLLVVAWQSAVSRRFPTGPTLIGVGLSLSGLFLVLDLLGDVRVDRVGVLWGLAAAVGLATYFVVAGDERSEVPPLAMASFGMLVGAAVLALAGVSGALPMRFSNDDVRLVGFTAPWFVPVIGLGIVSGAIAYSTGVAAARNLGAKISAFVGLSEVIFAVLFAWALLGELPRPVQLVGGILVLSGIVVVRREQLSSAEGEPESNEALIGVEAIPVAGAESGDGKQVM